MIEYMKDQTIKQAISIQSIKVNSPFVYRSLTDYSLFCWFAPEILGGADPIFCNHVYMYMHFIKKNLDFSTTRRLGIFEFSTSIDRYFPPAAHVPRSIRYFCRVTTETCSCSGPHLRLPQKSLRFIPRHPLSSSTMTTEPQSVKLRRFPRSTGEIEDRGATGKSLPAVEMATPIQILLRHSFLPCLVDMQDENHRYIFPYKVSIFYLFCMCTIHSYRLHILIQFFDVYIYTLILIIITWSY